MTAPAAALSRARAAAVAAALALAAAPASATNVGAGTISVDTTWTIAGSPWVVQGDVTVAAGATLTIAPGVTVMFENWDGLYVDGTLTAVGTALAPISFRHLSDAPASPWDGITVRAGTASRFEHASFDFGGYGGGNIEATGAGTAVTVVNATFSRSYADGLRCSLGATADVSSATFTGNNGYALAFQDGSVNPTLAGLAASANGTDGVQVGPGTLSGTHLWEAAGLPFVVTGDVTVDTGATLTIAPGVTVMFENWDGLYVDGTLTAVGTALAPISFRHLSDAPASPWDGITVRGTSTAQNVGSRFEHVVVDTGGYSGGNLNASYATVTVRNSVLRNSYADAVRATNAGGTVIANTQLIGVGASSYGVNGSGTGQILAANNWWGHPNGPTEGACNPAGSGTRVRGDVVYEPFLTSADGSAGAAAPIALTTVTLTPLRWFVQADGISRAWVRATVRTGDGHPAPDRTVTLASTLGTVTSGGVTDGAGETLAWITSNAGGEAVVTASLAASTCEAFRSGSATITFNAVPADPLFDEAAAPYLTDRLALSPLPITQGRPSVARVTIRNPNAFPMTVVGSLQIAQRGLGLTFGELGTVTATIPANAEQVLEVPWTPPTTGHYCVRFEYSATVQAAAAPGLARRAVGTPQAFTGSQQKNLDAIGALLHGLEELDAIQRAELVTSTLDQVNNIVGIVTGGLEGLAGFGANYLGGWMFGQILEFNFRMWRACSDALAGRTNGGGWSPGRFGDGWGAGGPGRYDGPVKRRLPQLPDYEPGGQPNYLVILEPWQQKARDVVVASAEVTADLEAAVIAQLRYRAATEAGSRYWAAQHAAAIGYFKARAGRSLVAFSAALESYMNELRGLGLTEVTVPLERAQAYLDWLAANGFDAEAQQAAFLAGFEARDLDALRAERLSATASEIAGPKLPLILEAIAVYRDAGETLAATDNFGGSSPSPFVAAGALVNLSATSTLVRVHTTTSAFKIGNPLGTTETIELRLRPVDLPPDWTVVVSPTAVTLAPGEVAEGTVTLTPGSAVPQGYVARVAVEGWVGSQLIGGVVADVVAPENAAFAAACDATAAKGEGTSCACSLECAGDLVCGIGSSGGSRCLSTCDLATPTCASARTCVSWVEGLGVCALDAADATPSGCGCGSGTGGALALLLAALALLRPRRRYA